MDSSTSMNRISITLSHLINENQNDENNLTLISCSNSEQLNFDIKKLKELNRPYLKEYRNQIYEVLKHPIFRPIYDISHKEHRELSLRRVKHLMATGLIKVQDLRDDPLKFLTFGESISQCDFSMTVKLNVHLILFGGSIMFLGTEKHHKQYFDAINDLRLPGSFTMTELNHGSNVNGIETTATYDRETDEIVLHTPHEGAQKTLIGNAACHGRATVCFAKLHVDGVNHGVHCFVCPLREEDMSPCAGIRVADNGAKMGLNGVDNGRVWFDHKRVPRDNLLDRYGRINDKGEYESEIQSKSKRFGVMVSPLVLGRMLIASGATDAAAAGLWIAIRYAHQRHQFPGKDKKEVAIASYQTHHTRLYTRLAATYAYLYGCCAMKEFYFANRTKDSKMIHVIVAGIKAMSTWNKTDTLRQCRECCGGQGVIMYNRLAGLIVDSEVDMTYEGDNTVLVQQVAKYSVTSYTKGKYVAVECSEQDPVTLRSTGFLARALAWREWHLAQTLADSLAASLSAGYNQTEAWENNMALAVDLGKAWTERYVFDRFVGAIERADASCKSILSHLSHLFAIYRIHADLGYFLAHNAFSNQTGRKFIPEILALCKEIHPHTLNLVEAFDIPDFLNPAPIAGNYVAFYSYSNRETTQIS